MPKHLIENMQRGINNATGSYKQMKQSPKGADQSLRSSENIWENIFLAKNRKMFIVQPRTD